MVTPMPAKDIFTMISEKIDIPPEYVKWGLIAGGGILALIIGIKIYRAIRGEEYYNPFLYNPYHELGELVWL